MGIFYGYSNRVLSYTIILFIVETDSELALSSFWSHCNLQMKAMDTRFPKEVAEKNERVPIQALLWRHNGRDGVSDH